MFRKRYPYVVTVKITGRHPYLRDDSLDMFEGFKYEYVHVMATGFDDAVKRCFGTYWNPASLVKTKGWAYAVVSVRHGGGVKLRPGRSAKGAFQLER